VVIEAGRHGVDPRLDGRLEMVLDTSDTGEGSARLLRVEHSALVTEQDFGRL
jgi:hypothetical protein